MMLKWGNNREKKKERNAKKKKALFIPPLARQTVYVNTAYITNIIGISWSV